MENFKNIWNDYKGAIIGVLVAIVTILIILTDVYKIFLAVILIILGAIAGHYIQQNKESVKQSIKNFIDKF